MRNDAKTFVFSILIPSIPFIPVFIEEANV